MPKPLASQLSGAQASITSGSSGAIPVMPASPHAPTAPPRGFTGPRIAPIPSNAVYRIHLSREQVIGPLTLPQTLELVATGRLHPSVQVSEAGADLAPLGRVPAFATLLDRVAFQFWSQPGPAAWQCEIERRTLAGVLFGIARRQETGLLLLLGGRKQKRVYFEHGVPRFVASTERSELLGTSLVRAGLLQATEVEQALELAGIRGQRLGEMLVALGLLKPTALLRALIEQLEARYAEVGSWGSGKMLFYPGERSEEDRINSHASALSLAARAVGEGFDDAEVAALLAPLSESPVVRLPASLDLSELGLSALQRRALELAPASGSIGRLVTRLAREEGARPEETLRGVFVGLTTGLLAAPGWPDPG
jgi:hypothetical protein